MSRLCFSRKRRQNTSVKDRRCSRNYQSYRKIKPKLKTAPQFIIKDDKDFMSEKRRLIDYIKKTQELGEDYFHNKESDSFGRLSKTEWNNMFYKHLDHHLGQFGV